MVYLTHFWKGKLDSYLIPYIKFQDLKCEGKRTTFRRLFTLTLKEAFLNKLGNQETAEEMTSQKSGQTAQCAYRIRWWAGKCHGRQHIFFLLTLQEKHSTVVISNVDGEAGTSTLFQYRWRSTAYSVFAGYSGTVTLGNVFSRIKSTSMEIFKYILNLVIVAKISKLC